MRPHGGNQRQAARSKRQTVFDDAINDRGIEAGKQRHALAQGRREGDLAIHRVLSDVGDAVLEVDLVAEFDDAFLIDYRRIAAGDKGFFLRVAFFG